MSNQKKYWKGIEELENTPEFLQRKNNEFAEELPVDKFLGNKAILEDTSTNRRDFLKFMGFSLSAVSLAACETPVKKAIPYLIKPEEITPGVATYYATTYYDGYDYCGVLVKTREGRPIKIEGNKLSDLNGSINARVQASVLSLYDSYRLKQPLSNKKESDWQTIDKEITSALQEIAAKGGNISILSSSVISPSLLQAISDFKNKYTNVELVEYDAISYAAIRKANLATFGKEIIPAYHFDKADVIVSFGADFLNSWINPIEYTQQYAKGRNPKSGKMSKHIQFEANLSLTGTNADKRYTLKPSETPLAIIALYNEIANKAGASTVKSPNIGNLTEKIKLVANELWNNKGKSLVVAKSNDINVQTIINKINELLGNYNNTIDITKPLFLKKGDEQKVQTLIKNMNEGKVDALFILNSNPVYTLPNAEEFKKGLEKVKLSVALTDRPDETTELVKYVATTNHILESWGDANPRHGYYGLTQPTIAPIFNTREALASFLTWTGQESDPLAYIKKYWEQNLYPKQTTHTTFEAFWNQSLHDGAFTLQEKTTETIATANLSEKTTDKKAQKAAETIKSEPSKDISENVEQIVRQYTTNSQWELEIYEKSGMGIGIQANNPWLQELPDSVTKVTWDNYLTMSPAQMKELGLNTKQGQEEKANFVNLTVGNKTIKVPVLAQPGQKKGTVGLAVGYGRTNAGKVANNVGVNAFALLTNKDGLLDTSVLSVKIEKTDGSYHFAATQTHHTMMGRDIVRETNLTDYLKDPKSGNPDVLIHTSKGKQAPEKVTLWAEHKKENHRWGLTIDLSTCIGCNACVISCQSENNVPVVGKDEIRRARDMFWLRVDRYYSSDATHADGFTAMEIPSEEDNLQVVHQPVMCQHCNHAPCETVCPVAATTHSAEGLNQMTYNRCIGTRYCANNCPYKVRRFNWFKYFNNDQFDFHMNDDLGKLVINPDVTVRSRGVMEKCSLCVQRIQEGKLAAKVEGTPVKDGAIQTACSAVCPTQAITFGDLNDESSAVASLSKDPRSYQLLAEVGTQPNVYYLTKVRNTTDKAV